MNKIGVGTCRVVTTLAVLALVACGSDTILSPGNDVQVSNVVNQFNWQASTLVDATDTQTYSWVITTPLATVSHANAALRSGNATVTIQDANGLQVYTAQLSVVSNGSATTALGAIGTWTVTVTLINATIDHINFTLDDVP